jgi:hypothetical protein
VISARRAGGLYGDVPSWRVDNMPYGDVKDSGLGREGVRCSESRNVGDAKRLFNASDLRYGVFKPVLAELLMFDFFELLAHLVEFMGRERIFPRRKHKRVLARGVMFVHQLDTIQSARQRFSVVGSNRSLGGHREHVIDDLPTTLMLRESSAIAIVTSTPGSSSCARNAALIPASLPPMMRRCMTILGE